MWAPLCSAQLCYEDCGPDKLPPDIARHFVRHPEDDCFEEWVPAILWK